MAVGTITSYGYDALGQVVGQTHQHLRNGTWTPCTTNRSYNRAGHVTSQTYPSQHSVSYSYDAAGRTNSFSGNLGDGTGRTYSTGIIYSPFGGFTREQFGTDTPIYNQAAYNSRGQLAEIVASTSPTTMNPNRGKLVNWYSDQCGGANCNNNDNNGNLRRQETSIPLNDPANAYTSWTQQFDYDALNRLKWVQEGGLRQEYVYDRYGNRRINTNPAYTYGGVNSLGFDLQTSSPDNRLYAPGDLLLSPSQRRMQYDNAGNLTVDTYTGAGARYYDAENRMTSALGGVGAVCSNAARTDLCGGRWVNQRSYRDKRLRAKFTRVFSV